MPVTIGGSGPITGVTSINTSVSDTELGYLDGVTSAIQSQINTAGGLVKITDQSFSAASSVIVTNCFSATYDWYKVVLSYTASANSQLNVKLRASGSDRSSGYYGGGVQTRSDSQAPSATAATANATTGWAFIATNGTNGINSLSLDIGGLNSAKASLQGTGIAAFYTPAGTAFAYPFFLAGMHDVSETNDSLSLLPTSGTITGSIKVFGYKN